MKSKLLLLVLSLGIHLSVFSYEDDDDDVLTSTVVFSTVPTILGNAIYGFKKGTLLTRAMVPSVVSYLGLFFLFKSRWIKIRFDKEDAARSTTRYMAEFPENRKKQTNTLRVAAALSVAGTALNIGQIINSALG